MCCVQVTMGDAADEQSSNGSGCTGGDGDEACRKK
jgi:hypothetical protein